MGIVYRGCYHLLIINTSGSSYRKQKLQGGKKMKKRVARLTALSMAALMTASLTACGSGGSGGDGSEGSGGSGGDKEITYWNIATEDVDKDIITKAVEAFNSNTESGYTDRKSVV